MVHYSQHNKLMGQTFNKIGLSERSSHCAVPTIQERSKQIWRSEESTYTTRLEPRAKLEFVARGEQINIPWSATKLMPIKEL